MVDIIKKTISEISKWIVIGIANNSYWICLFCAFSFLLLYIMGRKKFAKYVPITYVVYIFLQALKGIWI